MHERGARGVPLFTAGRRYLTAGLLSGATDLAIYSLLAKWLGVHPLLANIVSRCAGGFVSFVANKHWTFENKGEAETHIQFVRFWCVFAVSFMLSELLVGLFHSVLGWEAIVTKVAAESAVVAFNFMSHRHFTFR
ncbi:MAG: GtrA family protein [Verrucomicrobia bacterium]|nr:GtrA family protein [Verrucomicrobiota bacterium]